MVTTTSTVAMPPKKFNAGIFMAWAATIGGGFMTAAANFDKIEPMLKSEIGVFTIMFAMLAIGFIACYFMLAKPAMASAEHAHKCELQLVQLQTKMEEREKFEEEMERRMNQMQGVTNVQ